MNRRKLHDCCKTFVRGGHLALCGAWRAAVRQSAASHRSYIGPGAPMCKPEARPCLTHRCTAAPAEPAMRRSCLSTGPRGQAGHGEHQHQHLSHAAARSSPSPSWPAAQIAASPGRTPPEQPLAAQPWQPAQSSPAENKGTSRIFEPMRLASTMTSRRSLRPAGRSQRPKLNTRQHTMGAVLIQLQP